MMFTATMSVQNGQNRSEHIAAFQVRDFTNSAGQPVQVEDRVSVTLSKSSIVLRYPMTYTRTYNSGPRELVLVRDARGRDYNWLTNPCKDGLAADAACGSMVDPATGAAVSYSQGFCCRCDLDDYLGGGPSGITRANLQCSLLSSQGAQSAHCLRWGPLWYGAFALGAYQVHYVIEAVVEFCPADGSGGHGACTSQTVFLSPSSPGQCVSLTRASGTAGGSGGSGGSAACDVLLSLEGDFAAFQGARSFASDLLFKPHSCEDFGACGQQMTEAADRWLIVPKASTTSGSECNKVGVSHEAFYSQSQRCEKTVNSCIKEQLSDLYAMDALADSLGQQGRYFAKFHTDAGGRFAVDSVSSPTQSLALFETKRFQKSVVSMRLSADRIAYVVNVPRGKILSMESEPFEAKSGAGRLSVTLQNTGTVNGDFTVSINCTLGLAAPVLARQLSLSPGVVQTAQFTLEAESEGAASGACTATLQDGVFRVLDSASTAVGITALVQDRASQGGLPGEGDPTGDQGVNQAAGTAQECGARCDWTDFLCAALPPCWPRIAEYALVAVAVLCLVAVAVRRPGWLCCSCLLRPRAKGSQQQQQRRRRRRSSRVAEPDSSEEESEDVDRPHAGAKRRHRPNDRPHAGAKRSHRPNDRPHAGAKRSHRHRHSRRHRRHSSADGGGEPDHKTVPSKHAPLQSYGHRRADDDDRTVQMMNPLSVVQQQQQQQTGLSMQQLRQLIAEAGSLASLATQEPLATAAAAPLHTPESLFQPHRTRRGALAFRPGMLEQGPTG
jgi:hypothetical protein